MIFKKDILDHYRPFFISTFKICSVFMIKKKKIQPVSVAFNPSTAETECGPHIQLRRDDIVYDTYPHLHVEQ